MNKAVIIIIFLLFICKLAYTQTWETHSISDEYFADRYAKAVYHVGLGGGIGRSYYPEYKPENIFWKYTAVLRIYKTSLYNTLTPCLKFIMNVEDEDFTDEERFLSTRERMQPMLFLGVNTRFSSGINFINSYYPYLMIGGGYTDVQLETVFEEAGYVYNTRVEGDGWNVGAVLGCEFEIFKDIISLDLSSSYIFNSIQKRFGWEEDQDEDKEETVNEHEMVFSFGMIFNIF